MQIRCVALAAVGLLTLQTLPQRVFRGGVQTVAVYATVHDDSGRLVPDLTQNAFTVFDNDTAVDVSVFSNDIQPVTAVVMLDVSDSMAPKLERVRASVLSFVNALWRALDESIASLSSEQDRRVVLVLTDGRDSAVRGLPTLEGGPAALKQRVIADHDVMIYAVGFDDARGPGLDPALAELTGATGGGHVVIPPSG